MAFVKENQKRQKFSPKKEKTCVICNKVFLPYAPRQTTCSPECSRIQENRKQRENFKRKYIRKGYNQSGENNNIHKKKTTESRKNWVYSKYRKDYCEVCGKQTLETKLTFVVHHKDCDPMNNNPDNLITLCHSCHKLVHKGKIELNKA